MKYLTSNQLMKFKPQKYSLEDVSMQPFIDANEIEGLIENTASTAEKVRQVIAKSLSKKD